MTNKDRPAASTLASIKAALLTSLLTFFHVFVEPTLIYFNLIEAGDPTYGRGDLPHSQTARRLIYDNPAVKSSSGKVLLKREALLNGGSWERSGTSWVHYYIWEAKQAQNSLHADLILVHGLNDHAHKLAAHALRFAEAGFRVIAVDLPSFGRSTGLHAYVPSMRLLVEAVHAVICKIRAEESDGSGPRRKLFIEGHSMGGFTALYYAALYAPDTKAPSTSARPQLDGVVVAAPMLAISPESRPPYVVEIIARILAFFAGRLPFARAINGNASDDPRVEEEHILDPAAYKGRLRIATGLAVLSGLEDLQQRAPTITVPCYFTHGSKDRVTNWKGTVEFYERISSTDKTLKIWEDYEHIMMKHVTIKGGMSPEDKAKTSAVLEEIVEWLVAHAQD